MAKAKKTTGGESNDAAKRVSKVYKLIKEAVHNCSRINGYTGMQAELLGDLGKDYLAAEAEYDAVSREISGKVDEFEQQLVREKGMEAIKSRMNTLRDKVSKGYDKLKDRFDKIAIRVESGQNPEKVIDALLALAEEVGVIDPLPEEKLVTNDLVDQEPHLGSVEDADKPAGRGADYRTPEDE